MQMQLKKQENQGGQKRQINKYQFTEESLFYIDQLSREFGEC